MGSHIGGKDDENSPTYLFYVKMMMQSNASVMHTFLYPFFLGHIYFTFRKHFLNGCQIIHPS